MKVQPLKEPPFVCPVCGGRGKVDVEFYEKYSTTAAEEVACRTCAGRDIVWRPDPTWRSEPPVMTPGASDDEEDDVVEAKRWDEAAGYGKDD